MAKTYANISELLRNELNTKEHTPALELIRKFSHIKNRGYLTKDEFLDICMWKSPRPKRHYQANSEKNILGVSKQVFNTNFEKRKIDLLTSLNGVSIPVASAILTITDPKNYGIIDIRTWKVLYRYKAVKIRPTGTNFSFKNWYNYLMQLRYFSTKYGVSTRDIERTLFDYHVKSTKGLLYKR